MEVILLQDVEKLGLRGDVVSVARGYARNFLIPRQLAEAATAAKVEQLRKLNQRRTLQEARSSDQAEVIAEALRKTVLRFEMKAGPTGALFGSVTPSDLADEIWRVRKIRIDRRKIELPEPLKRIGSYLVPIQIFEGVSVELKTLVVPEGGELPPEQELAIETDEQERPAAEDAAPEEEAPSVEQDLETSDETPA
ncbi:MAG: 50S ribosomal protein L9 [Gaiellaceae bacterium]|jgi:large subunit ribosomal protein L9